MGTHVPAQNEHGYTINGPIKGPMRAYKGKGQASAREGGAAGRCAHRRNALRARID